MARSKPAPRMQDAKHPAGGVIQFLNRVVSAAVVSRLSQRGFYFTPDCPMR